MNAMNRGLAIPSMEVYTVTNKHYWSLYQFQNYFHCGDKTLVAHPKEKHDQGKF
jgi:hypothetical protein